MLVKLRHAAQEQALLDATNQLFDADAEESLGDAESERQESQGVSWPAKETIPKNVNTEGVLLEVLCKCDTLQDHKMRVVQAQRNTDIIIIEATEENLQYLFVLHASLGKEDEPEGDDSEHQELPRCLYENKHKQCFEFIPTRSALKRRRLFSFVTENREDIKEKAIQYAAGHEDELSDLE